MPTVVANIEALCQVFVRKQSPVFVGDNAPLHLLVVLANANSQPGAQLAVVESVHHTEHLALVKA